MAHDRSKQIFKLQRSVASTDNVAKVLIYNASRSIFQEIELTEEMVALFDGDLKIYVVGSINKEGILTIHERIGEQLW